MIILPMNTTISKRTNIDYNEGTLHLINLAGGEFKVNKVQIVTGDENE